jgi:hypothetical protein
MLDAADQSQADLRRVGLQSETSEGANALPGPGHFAPVQQPCRESNAPGGARQVQLAVRRLTARLASALPQP